VLSGYPWLELSGYPWLGSMCVARRWGPTLYPSGVGGARRFSDLYSWRFREHDPRVPLSLSKIQPHSHLLSRWPIFTGYYSPFCRALNMNQPLVRSRLGVPVRPCTGSTKTKTLPASTLMCNLTHPLWAHVLLPILCSLDGLWISPSNEHSVTLTSIPLCA